jgi:hypothetical protein
VDEQLEDESLRRRRRDLLAVIRLHHGLDTPPPRRAPVAQGLDELERLLREGQKIQAIKRHRELTGSGLKQAKDAIEALEARLLPRATGPVPGPSHAGNSEEAKAQSLLWLFILAVVGALLLALAWQK